MKKIKLFLFVCVFSASIKAQTINDPINLNGVWMYNATNVTPQALNTLSTLPYPVKGAGIYLYWKDLQPTPTTFNWNILDNALTKLSNANLYATLMVWTGPSVPYWVYSTVDSVKTNDNSNTFYLNRYPYYFDPQYKPLWFKMLDSVIIHCSTRTPVLKNNIKIFQSAQGTTGDLTWYKGTPTNVPTSTVGCACTSYTNITDANWVSNILQREWKRTDSLLTIYLPQAHHLVNAGTDKIVNSTDYLNNFIWSRANMPYLWYKANNMAHWYQMNDEPDSKSIFDTIINQSYNNQCYPKVRTRDEFDLANNNAELYSPNWHLYFTAANALHFGVDMWNIFSNDISLPDNFEGLEFFSKYAGIKTSSCSPGAFSVLRDGLDAEDFVRFPSSTYGTGTSTNTAASRNRCIAIANSYSVYGASQDTPNDAQGGAFNQVTASGLNDVGWNIFPGNYERYITQWNPNATSIGYWRQGDTMQAYGRFARGFDHANGKDTLFFNIDDGFFNTFPNNANTTVSVNITYLDKGTGTWALQYNALNNSNQSVIRTAFTHTNANTTNSLAPNPYRNWNYVWKTISVTITNGYFGNNCGHGCDLRIVNKDNTDEIFHKIEILKATSIVGAEELKNDFNAAINIFPNPTKNYITVDFTNLKNSEYNEINIYNLLGQNVYVGEIDKNEKNITIDVRGLTNGFYLLELSGPNSKLVKKIIKE